VFVIRRAVEVAFYAALLVLCSIATLVFLGLTLLVPQARA